jgi:hypothetical protein
MFYRGDSVVVRVPGKEDQTGKVAYQRMAGPDYSRPKSVSVILDSLREYLNYSGTIFPAEQVFPYLPKE